MVTTILRPAGALGEDHGCVSYSQLCSRAAYGVEVAAWGSESPLRTAQCNGHRNRGLGVEAGKADANHAQLEPVMPRTER